MLTVLQVLDFGASRDWISATTPSQRIVVDVHAPEALNVQNAALINTDA